MSERDASASRETARSRGAHAPGRDPRDIVTEYAFQVDRDLLGVPLASPLRRLGGILLDLVVLGLLFPFRAAASALLGGIVDLLVALAVAWVLFRLASPNVEGRTPSGAVRFVLRGAGVIIGFTGLIAFLGGEDGGDTPGGADAPGMAGAQGDSVPAVVTEVLDDVSTAAGGPGRVRMGDRSVSLGEIAGGVGDFVGLARADDPAEAGPAAERVAMNLHRMGARPSEVREALRGMLTRGGSEEAPDWTDTVIERAVARVDSTARAERLEADSAVVRYARALAEGDTAAADELRPRLRDAVAGEDLRALRERNRELEEELEDATSTPSLLRRGMDVVTDDLGIGLGWIGIYFTAFLALWKGRTPGKRLLGMRVVQLDGSPVGWWDAFGRFGGYAAGFATGLIGFLQVFWDPNRQALHDRVAGTVVIRTRGPGRRYERDAG